MANNCLESPKLDRVTCRSSFERMMTSGDDLEVAFLRGDVQFDREGLVSVGFALSSLSSSSPPSPWLTGLTLVPAVRCCITPLTDRTVVAQSGAGDPESLRLLRVPTLLYRLQNDGPGRRATTPSSTPPDNTKRIASDTARAPTYRSIFS
ncbi:hypothetical protein NW754_16790 [Fusarium falciforme]|nr:hypothetical protein NW754_16790 [Fusarium falciforme]